jgi:hypothetical protein
VEWRPQLFHYPRGNYRFRAKCDLLEEVYRLRRFDTIREMS